MTIHLDPRVAADFDPLIGVIVARGMTVTPDTTAITALLRSAEAQARAQFSADGAILTDARLAAWRAVYKRLGAGDYRPSAEALIRRVVKDAEIPSITPLVDIYNAISLMHALPIGGEDLSTIRGALRLCYATGDEAFIRLGGDTNESPVSGEVIYADDDGAICRRWNWREADRTKLTPTTSDALLVVDSLMSIGPDTTRAATQALADHVADLLGASVTLAYLDTTSLSATFS